MRHIPVIVGIFLLLGTQLSFAQGPQGPAARAMQKKGEKVAKFMQGKLFPPHIIMAQQSKLNITDAQKKEILAAVSEAQTKVLEVKWEVQENAEALSNLLDQDRIDQEKVIKQLEKLFSAENQTKMQQILLMIKIKNVLTPQQIQHLKSVSAW